MGWIGRTRARNTQPTDVYNAVYLRQHCAHPRIVMRSEEDGCFWAVCCVCGRRGPRKHSRPLARARMRSVGVTFRGVAQRVRYTRTAARDDARFATGGAA